MSRSYSTFMLSEEPKLCGISLITIAPALVLTLIGLVFGMVYEGMMIGGLLSFVMHIKFGAQGIRVFLSIVYWSLPRKVSLVLGLRRFPDSAKRIFLK